MSYKIIPNKLKYPFDYETVRIDQFHKIYALLILINSFQLATTY